MKIHVGYTEKAIDKAIKQVEEYRKRFQELIPNFLHKCGEKIIELANEKIAAYDFDGEIINEIQSGWYIQPVSNTKKGASVTIRNRSEKATYIEFGVGQVGATQSHEIADKVHYGYDIQEHGNNGWYFYVNPNEGIDILNGLYQAEDLGGKRDRLRVHTKGSPATMFAFNAVQDFMDNKMYEPIWKELIKGL